MLLNDFFSKGAPDVRALGQYLDGLTGDERRGQIRALTGKQQAALFDAAKGVRPIALADFVPDAQPPLAEVIHDGKNSLPIFTEFQKRFCKPPDAAQVLWGYNEQALKWATGPGYFKVRPLEGGEVLIDYTEVPPGKAISWPEVRPNSARLSRFVYYNTQDTMRGVSKHVTVGRAARKGKPMDNWFVLCRR